MVGLLQCVVVNKKCKANYGDDAGAQDILYNDDDEAVTLADPADKFEELLTR